MISLCIKYFKMSTQRLYRLYFKKYNLYDFYIINIQRLKLHKFEIVLTLTPFPAYNKMKNLKRPARWLLLTNHDDWYIYIYIYT